MAAATERYPASCTGATWRKWLIALTVIIAIDLVATVTWTMMAVLAVPSDRGGAAIGVLWGDDTQLGSETLRRVKHAYELWREGDPSRIVICVGGRRPSAGVNGAEEACGLLRRMGVSADRLEVGTGSNDTISNLRDLAGVAHRLGVSSISVVASPIQALRASMMLDHHGVTLGWSTYPIRSIPLARLWRNVHHEWLALSAMALPEGLRLRLLGLARA